MSRKDFIYGLHPVLKALTGNRRKQYFSLFVKKSRRNADNLLLVDIATKANVKNVKLKEVESSTIDSLLTNNLGNLSFSSHQGVILSCSPIELEQLHASNISKLKQKKLWILLDQIQDPQNVGAIIRSAYFFGAGVLLSKQYFLLYYTNNQNRSSTLSPAVCKASSGAVEVVDLYQLDHPAEVLSESKKLGVDVIGTSSNEPKSVDISKLEVGDSSILILGNEGQGISKQNAEQCNKWVSIQGPNQEDIGSLNVSVAGKSWDIVAKPLWKVNKLNKDLKMIEFLCKSEDSMVSLEWNGRNENLTHEGRRRYGGRESALPYKEGRQVNALIVLIKFKSHLIDIVDQN